MKVPAQKKNERNDLFLRSVGHFRQHSMFLTEFYNLRQGHHHMQESCEKT